MQAQRPDPPAVPPEVPAPPAAPAPLELPVPGAPPLPIFLMLPVVPMPAGAIGLLCVGAAKPAWPVLGAPPAPELRIEDVPGLIVVAVLEVARLVVVAWVDECVAAAGVLVTPLVVAAEGDMFRLDELLVVAPAPISVVRLPVPMDAALPAVPSFCDQAGATASVIRATAATASEVRTICERRRGACEEVGIDSKSRASKCVAGRSRRVCFI